MVKIDYGDPKSFFVFLVGNCEEWPESREEQGDMALYQEYVNAGVPTNQIMYLKDDRECTKVNCQEQLLRFLKGTRPCTTLVFYYGGHGKPLGFAMQDDSDNENDFVWPYQDVVSMIDCHFHGDRVLYLLDCCASGNLIVWLAPPNDTNLCGGKQYVALAQSPAYIEASDDVDEWVMGNCWLKSLRCGGDGSLPLSRVVDFLADHTAQELGDQFTAYHSPNADMTTCDWMPRRSTKSAESTSSSSSSSSSSSKLEWKRLEYNIPCDAKVTTTGWSVGDTVFYKHFGGKWNGGSYRDYDEYIPPLWLPGKILAIEANADLRLQVCYTPTQFTWQVLTPTNGLMNDFYMGQMWMMPKQFQAAQCQLARNFKYLHYSALPACAAIKAHVGDGKVREAAVLDWRDFDWKAYLESGECNQQPPYGAHVPVRWRHNQKSTLVSLHDIQSPSIDNVEPFLEIPKTFINGDMEEWARKALIKSIESSGKSICNARTKFGENLVAYWPDGKWYNAKPLDPETVSLKTLASHAQFVLSGMYCPILYEDDEIALSPLHYVRERRTKVKCP